jgi:predicted dehydrogenase
LRDNFPYDLFFFRSRGKRSLKNELGIPEVYSWAEVKGLNADVAFITNPTFAHIKTARACALLGMHLFIEKPLSNSLEDIDSLEAMCRKKKLTCYVAYCLRFHPVIKELHRLISGKKIHHVRVTCSSYLPFWRKGTDSKNSYSGVKSQGGGVLLDLSHEFDYIKHLFGEIKTIAGVYGKAGTVSLDSEDFADVLLIARQAPRINLHLNFLSLMDERRIVIDHEQGCVIGDLLQNKVELLKGRKKTTKQFTVTRDGYLKEQIEYFFNHLGDPLIMNSCKEAKQLLKKILRFKHG